MRTTRQQGAPAPMTHAEQFTADLCGLYAGPHAAKRMAGAWQRSVETCRAYLKRHRAMSFDQAVEAAARDEHAMTALLARVAAARARNAELQVAVRQGAHVGVGVDCGRSGAAVRDGGAAGGPGQGGGGPAAAALDRRASERRGRGG